MLAFGGRPLFLVIGTEEEIGEGEGDDECEEVDECEGDDEGEGNDEGEEDEVSVGTREILFGQCFELFRE